MCLRPVFAHFQSSKHGLRLTLQETEQESGHLKRLFYLQYSMVRKMVPGCIPDGESQENSNFSEEVRKSGNCIPPVCKSDSSHKS